MLVNLFDFTANEFSKCFKSSCYSAKRFAECFLEVTLAGDKEANLADSSDLPNKNPQATVSSDSEIDVSTPQPNTVLKKKRKNLATIPERFTDSPDIANDDNAEEIMYSAPNSSQKVAKKRSSSTSTTTVSPPVPSKVKKCSVERSNDKEKDNNPDSQFLEDIKKYTVPGK